MEIQEWLAVAEIIALFLFGLFIKNYLPTYMELFTIILFFAIIKTNKKYVFVFLNRR